MVKWIVQRLAALLVICLFIVFGTGFIKTGKIPPENIQIYIDKTNGTFITPPCVDPSQLEQLKKLEHYPKNDVPEKYKKFVAAGDCTWDSLEVKSNLSKDILRWMGFGKDPMSRWNEDGSWNW
jgi:hypothetical protein